MRTRFNKMGLPEYLPVEYQRLQYLEVNSPNDANPLHFKTNVIADNTTIIFCDCFLPNSDFAYCVFGARAAFKDRGLCFLQPASNSSGSYRYDWGADSATFSHATGRHTIIADKNSLKIDGATVATVANSTWTSPVELYLLTMNNNGAFMQFSATGLKIYNLRIEQGGAVVREYIPALRKSDNVLGLYDCKNKSFLTASGIGSFNYE